MCSQWAALATFAVMILAKSLAPPATGWLYNDNSFGGSYIFPLTATQCQPFDIFYNTTDDGDFFYFSRSDFLFLIEFPRGIGYLEWICSIPAGIGFNVGSSLNYTVNYVVQAGSSSACLGNITTTYSRLTYATLTVFASHTRTTSSFTPLPTNTLPTTTFPTGAYSTITLNPNLADTPTSSTSSPPSSTLPSPSSSSPSSSSPTALPSPKSHSASAAGGLVGATAFVLLISTLVRWWRRRHSVLAKASSPIDPQPSSISGLATGQLGSTNLSSPFRSSGAEFLGRTQQYPFSPLDLYSHRTEPTSNNPIDVPVTGNPAAHVDPIVGQRSSRGAIIPLEADSALPSQRPREAPDSGHQASFPNPVPGLASPANAQPTTTGELESTYLSPLFQSSGAELPGTTPAPRSHRNELRSDSGAMVVPVIGNLEPPVVPVALSPANSESATLSMQQTYDGSTIITSGGAVGSGNININTGVFNIYNIHRPQPDLSSSLSHLPEILSTSAAQASE